MARIIGTSGPDTLHGTGQADYINGRGGDDKLFAVGSDDTLIGGAGDDTLFGGNNGILKGGRGDDTLYAASNCTLNGGQGNDTYVIDLSSSNVVLSDPGGIDTVIVHRSWTLGAGFENLVGGSTTHYAMSYVGNDLDNVITHQGLGAYVDGADGDDTLLGGSDWEVFQFSAGSGNYGHDYVDGGGGHDSISAGRWSAVTIDLRNGTATGGGTGGSGSIVFVNIEGARGGAFDDLLIAGDAGADLWGSAGNDTLRGGAGDDSLHDDFSGYDSSDDQRTGDDLLIGGGGNDIITTGRGNDTVKGGAGDDWIGIRAYHFGYDDDVIAGGAGSDTVSIWARTGVVVNLGAGSLAGGGPDGGGSAKLSSIENFVVMGDADAFIKGSRAANRLEGGAGNDTLIGGAGSDVLLGGGGNDTLLWDPADSRIDGGAGTDTLRVVGAGVTLDLTLIDNGRIAGIEIIDITGSGDNALTLSLEDLLDLSNSTDALTVEGNAGDTLTVTNGDWTSEGRAGDYDIYTSGAARLKVFWDISADVPVA